MNDFNENTKGFGSSVSSNKFSIAKTLKWILGIALAGVLSLGPASYIMHHNGDVNMNRLNNFQYWVTFLTVPSIGFGLFLFLSCLLVPVHKKYAGILVMILSIIFIVLGSYQHYIDDGFLASQYIIRYSGFMIGLAIGFMIGYKLFKNNKW
jgi:hypothetical protein